MEKSAKPFLTTVNSSDSTDVVCKTFLMRDTRFGQLTLDVGCGNGDMMVKLREQGCEVFGTEVDLDLIADCKARGLDVCDGKAESLPFDDSTFDRIVCSVVIPYTEENRAIAEWARVLKPGGKVYATYHGIGYGLDYVMRGTTWKKRVYGLRMLVNTGYFWLTKRRMPGFLGDTTCQSAARLRSYYDALGLKLERESIASLYLGFPQFICHELEKPGAALGVGRSDQQKAASSADQVRQKRAA